MFIKWIVVWSPPRSRNKMVSAPETSQVSFPTASSSIPLVVTTSLTFQENHFYFIENQTLISVLFPWTSSCSAICHLRSPFGVAGVANTWQIPTLRSYNDLSRQMLWLWSQWYRWGNWGKMVEQLVQGHTARKESGFEPKLSGSQDWTPTSVLFLTGQDLKLPLSGCGVCDVSRKDVWKEGWIITAATE